MGGIGLSMSCIQGYSVQIRNTGFERSTTSGFGQESNSNGSWSTRQTNVRIIHDVDEEAMKADFFNTLNGKPTALPPKRQN